MTSVTLHEAQANLPELIAGLKPGEELLICRNHQPVAKLVGQSANGAAPRRSRQLGRQEDQILYMAEDFNAPLEEFKDYME